MNDQHVVSIRLTAEQADTLAAAAAAEGVPISAYIRDAALSRELRHRPGTHVRQLPNGGELLWWSSSPAVLA
jgi:hypothetical protein